MNKLSTHRPATIRAAGMNHITRKMDAVVQRLDDLRDAEEERKRERRRRGR